MPYITKFNRTRLSDGGQAFTAGELNYEITSVISDYLRAKGESYQSYNDIIGALEGAKLELYRRKIVPYEDKKIAENGDVYD